ncbi:MULTISPECIES: ExbD/TolR family protein [Psychrobacter]|jgi:biopolymer transport protein ExbD|uniref:Biopolymer transport protein ExbD/TolR n=1 Tax=Psychrobacter nivimaris TaxID=281738 RepID=A0A6N7C2S5_9GAMM|nr:MULTISPECIES: biopolymer transporter ExbD [Psychrobacter]KAF0570144.1 Biopolymer transport protein ExbD/TolR [Psychrobacter nivimaris]KRG36544.1 biopolymer transporter ExbD [Psychrobacter sp. P11G3]MBA6245335.1 biopolymer transporter ExbD [Psychrobacter sp. Urea-trap-18]MBA6286923.1 biopolymer transporter ExbD [Psychrobacter sp. Urea-trap-16]MBA6317895.1 biopolymer transporter ExbD [Psychrobacter sp. Urea-trap-20]|tara:strand:+ start:103915 stop:104346 length:432 start_codon:yes stop_codon:yes gene_type:complete
MRFRKPTVEPLEINLTPMIDCLLFLIVFLLLATSFNHFSRLNIILPEAEGVALTEQNNSIEVAVQEDGSYLVNGITLASSNEAELTSMLQQEAGSNRDMLFVIAADANATHQSVVRVMDIAGKLGFLNLNISTVVPLGQTLPQ